MIDVTSTTIEQFWMEIPVSSSRLSRDCAVITMNWLGVSILEIMLHSRNNVTLLKSIVPIMSHSQ